MQTWNMNVLFCSWTPRALANHIKTKTVGVYSGQKSKETHLPVLVCIPLDRLLFVHTSAIEVPVEGSISILPQWFNSQAIWIQSLVVMWVDIIRSNHVQDCVLKSSILSHKVILLSHLSSDSLWTAFISKPKKNQQAIFVRWNKCLNYHRNLVSTSNLKTVNCDSAPEETKKKKQQILVNSKVFLNFLHNIMI